MRSIFVNPSPSCLPIILEDGNGLSRPPCNSGCAAHPLRILTVSCSILEPSHKQERVVGPQTNMAENIRLLGPFYGWGGRVACCPELLASGGGLSRPSHNGKHTVSCPTIRTNREHRSRLSYNKKCAVQRPVSLTGRGGLLMPSHKGGPAMRASNDRLLGPSRNG